MNRSSLRVVSTSMALGLGASALAILPFAAPAGAVATPGDTVFINELHYDNDRHRCR